MALVTSDGAIRIWDVIAGELVRKLSVGQLYADILREWAWSPDGQRLALLNEQNQQVFWDANLDTRIGEPVPAAKTDSIRAFAGNNTLVTASEGRLTAGVVQLWDVQQEDARRAPSAASDPGMATETRLPHGVHNRQRTGFDPAQPGCLVPRAVPFRRA
ncbi:WD40 repeat domain-containing protein [Streptomyces sp. NPDC056468]|uniref:WD40 repeat domain-containing protein n=1 Tax=Streptomyces sp. NPDC056468 TaxID=3345830 RepID=UPI00369AFEBC